MNTRVIKANLLLFTAAVVWGTTFVAQRVGMDHLGPVTYTAARFTLGALAVLPLALMSRGRKSPDIFGPPRPWIPVVGTLLAGLAMYASINLQQIGLVDTTAGNAGFITGLYVVITPLLGLLWGIRPSWGVWLGGALAAVGLYLLSVTDQFSLRPGDGWVLACAFCCAGHAWILGWFSPRMDSFALAFGQTFICAILSWATALFLEPISFSAMAAGWIPIAYGGIMSAGIGFTLQVMGQKDSPPAHAVTILQLEAVVAAISGWLILDESMSARAAIGASLMLAGMLTAQLWPFLFHRKS